MPSAKSLIFIEGFDQMNATPKNLDEIDKKIVRALQIDGRMPIAELSEKVGLSPTPCGRRVKELERQRIIKNYVALLDAAALDLTINVFVMVTMTEQTERNLRNFEESIAQRPEVMECYLMTGEADYMLRVLVSSLSDYERFVMSHLTKIVGVANIKSSFALHQVKYRTAIPI
jgi:DNA-binding Lrp family transcriptional regulator